MYADDDRARDRFFGTDPVLLPPDVIKARNAAWVAHKDYLGTGTLDPDFEATERECLDAYERYVALASSCGMSHVLSIVSYCITDGILRGRAAHDATTVGEIARLSSFTPGFIVYVIDRSASGMVVRRTNAPQEYWPIEKTQKWLQAVEDQQQQQNHDHQADAATKDAAVVEPGAIAVAAEPAAQEQHE